MQTCMQHANLGTDILTTFFARKSFVPSFNIKVWKVAKVFNALNASVALIIEMRATLPFNGLT